MQIFVLAHMCRLHVHITMSLTLDQKIAISGIWRTGKIGCVEPQGNIGECCCCPQNVTNLDLEQNIFVGQLPMDWAAAGRFPSLASLQLWNNSLTGAIPATWTNATALPALTSL